MEIGYFLVMFLMLPVQQHHFFIADLELKLTVFFVKDEFIGSVNYSHLYRIPSDFKFPDILLELWPFCYIGFLDGGCLTGRPLFIHAAAAAVRLKSQRLEIAISYSDTSDILLPCRYFHYAFLSVGKCVFHKQGNFMIVFVNVVFPPDTSVWKCSPDKSCCSWSWKCGDWIQQTLSLVL